MNSLNDAQVARSLAGLHEAARGDARRRAARRSSEDALIRLGELFLAVSPEEGRLLYLLARGSGATSLVEFGASFGVSTLYLAAAARDNGGRLITTEVHPQKCEATRKVLAEAGLDNAATLLEGDARETLRDARPGIGFVFLDGWKGMYLPMLEILLPKLRPGALVAADNIDHAAARDYAARVGSDEAFVSHRLGKMELSCYAGGPA
jgi:predicted O-methyltransferase YrrM